MAGMLPGVELARRRRTNHHLFETSNSRDSTHRYSRDSTHRYHGPHQQQRFESSTTNMDETALKARKRLEEKLRGLNGSTYRWSKTQTKMNDAIRTSSSNHINDQALSEVCSICLEEFRSKQQVMNLACSHRYHSDCLLPWLNAHSHCPYCRAHVNLDAPPTST